MHLHTPPFASISNRGKRHFLERDRGACSASIDLNVPLAASCHFSLGFKSRTENQQHDSDVVHVEGGPQQRPTSCPRLSSRVLSSSANCCDTARTELSISVAQKVAPSNLIVPYYDGGSGSPWPRTSQRLIKNSRSHSPLAAPLLEILLFSAWRFRRWPRMISCMSQAPSIICMFCEDRIEFNFGITKFRRLTVDLADPSGADMFY
jgi:hypothetical protein